MKGFRLFAFLPVAFAVACAPTRDDLNVNVFHLHELGQIDKKNPMMRAEQQKRLHGAVSTTEKQQRMGSYYTVRWDVDALEGSSLPAPERVVFQYRQASSASKVLRQAHELEGVRKGSCEFRVIGDAFSKGGRVLNWKVEVVARGKVLASEQSYMWQ